MKYNSTEQSVSWFRDQYVNAHLTINPPYQRKPVWADRQKSSLIESILLEYPIPEIFLQEVVDADGTSRYAVVDGQQRIRTVLQFVGVDRDPSDETDNGFALARLPSASQWANKTIDDLSDAERRSFFGYKFGVRLLATDDENEVRGLFARLNRFLSPLSAPELRNAIYTGPFARLAVQLADNEYWAQNGIVGAAAIRRMQDVEFVADLLIGVMHGPQDGGDATLDEYYRIFEDFDDEFPEEKSARKRFDATLTLIQRVLPDIRRTRWSNRADFYSLAVVLSHVAIQARSIAVRELKSALSEFSDQIEALRANPDEPAPTHVVSYVRALERGANGKTRRAARNTALTLVVRRAVRFREPPVQLEDRPIAG